MELGEGAAGGWSVKRRPWEVPSAPMRSVRKTLGTPPTNSKNRTRPSKVCSRSMQGVNHQIRTRDHDKMAEKHWTSPSPHSLRPVRDVGPVELGLLARCGHDPGRRRRRRAEPRTAQAVFRCRATLT